jgi:hypothetical protein
VNILMAFLLLAGGDDPQVATDHPWYPGELSASSFERLFRTQAALYGRVTGRRVESDEDKALASWYWRNLNYAHSVDGNQDCWGKGLKESDVNREYWTGLHAFGQGLCFTTHAQWVGEMEKLLGHGRARAAFVPGHTSFEVFLTGGAYGAGRWALLDHDISTVIFHEDGSRLLSIKEISEDLQKYADGKFKPARQRGWFVGGLHRDDPKVYTKHTGSAHQFGYAGPPPRLNLRPGESIRRYLRPGLEDGKTWVYWGVNYMSKASSDPEPIPGPSRDRAWALQPDKMHGSTTDTGTRLGYFRYGNAVTTYVPDFRDGSYRAGIVDESDAHVTFEFSTPYLIACTPPRFVEKDGKPAAWSIYEDGATNGLILKGSLTCPVQVSVDRGATWTAAQSARDGLDLTDAVKGHAQYFLKLGAPAAALAGSGLSIRTVCQTNPTLIPHLKDGGTKVTFAASGLANVSAGPTVPLAKARIVEGAFQSPTVTLELAVPGGRPAVHVYAAAHVASGNPPADCVYQIESSTDAGKTWSPVAKDWRVVRQGEEPADFWSQALCFGDAPIPATSGPVRVRFRNDGKRQVLRAEMHLAYRTGRATSTEVTFAWREGKAGALKTAARIYAAATEEDSSWVIPTGSGVDTSWVEYRSRP